MTTDWTQTTRMLKGVVVVLGVAIVVGVVILAVEVIRRIDTADDGDRGERFATATVALPQGARVITMTGEDDVLSLLVEGPDGRQRVVTVDRRSGAVLGTLELISEVAGQ